MGIIGYSRVKHLLKKGAPIKCFKVTLSFRNDAWKSWLVEYAQFHFQK